MDIKVRLNDVDINLLERVSDITGTGTGIDQDGWIDVSLLLATIDDLEDKYSDLRDMYNDVTEEESLKEYISNRDFDRGFHRGRYE